MGRNAEIFESESSTTMSDLLFYIIDTKQPEYIDIDDFLRLAFGIAKTIFPHQNRFDSRKMEEVELIKALTYATYVKYKKEVTLSIMGMSIANAIGRSSSYDHATILHKKREHLKAAKFKFGYEGYINNYTKFIESLRRNNLL